MTSSGMKRGLAVSAISALAMTGLPLFAGAANAVPLSSQAGAPVVLQTGAGMTTPGVSVHNDGVNTTAHLVATAQSSVTQIEFSYIPAGGTASDAVSIAKVSGSNGDFSTEWNVPAVIYNTTVTLQAQGFDKDGNPVGSAVPRDVFVSPTASSVDIANAPGSTVNVFKAPYTGHQGLFGAVSGTTSDAGTPNPVWVNGNALLAPKYGDPANGIRTFSGIADFGYGYNWGTDTDADQALVHAVVAGSDDNEAVVLQQQQIKNVTAVAANPNPPASNPDTTVTVTVKDQNGNPIYGAQVVDEAAPSVAQYTDPKGQAVFTATGSAAGATYKYLVNTTDVAGYDAAVDYEKTVTITTYADSAAGIVSVPSDLGSALDFDEYGAHPVKIQVNDNKGAAEAGQTVKYSWTVKPFDTTATAPAPETGSVTTGPDGTVAVPAPASNVPGTYTLNAYQELDGNPGQSAGDRSMAPVTLKMGQAALTFTDGSVAEGLAGTSKSFDAKLALEDGTPLAGRAITFGYTPGTGGGADSAVSATQPGNTVRDSASAAHDKTDSSGMVSVSLTDPKATPQAAERGGDLTASGVNFTGGDLTVDWLRSLTASSVDFGTQKDLVDNEATPGRPVSQSVTVYNADGDKLTDQTFTLTTDHGSFTPYAANAAALTADPAAANGGLYGEWKSLGKSIQVTTDDAGTATYTTDIERDSGFDDDGAVTSTVTVAGIKGATDSVAWESGDSSVSPLNPGSLKVQLADKQDVSIVKAKGMAPVNVGKNVYYDVIATDQFGNRVEAPVKVTEDSTNPTATDGTTEGTTSNFIDQPAIVASSTDAAVQKFTATWNADTNKYGDTDPTKDGVQLGRVTSKPADTPAGGATLTDTSAPLTWYVVDLEHGQYSMSRTGAATQPVGNVVTETYQAKDQNGEPVKGLQVVFFRSGPDNLQDGSGNAGGYTDSNGQVSYTYQGAKAGKAVTTAVVSKQEEFYNNSWSRVTAADASDTVSFVVPIVQQHIAAGLSLGNTKYGNDIAKVTAPAAAHGATVKLYKISADGKRHLIATKTANKWGDASFTVKDLNGKKYTKYQAYVGATVRTFADWTVSKSIR